MTLTHEFLDIERECGFEVSDQSLDDLLERAEKTIDITLNPRRILLEISKFLDEEFRKNGDLSLSLDSECGGYSVLSYSICERLGLEDNVDLVSAPSHVFMRWNNKSKYLNKKSKDLDKITKFNWDTNTKVEATDEQYISTHNIHPDSIENKVYMTELTREQTKAIAYDTCGALKLKEGDDDAAIKCLDKSIESNSKFTHSYCYRGHAKGKKGNYDEAIADLNESIRLDPNYYHPYHYRGLIRIDQRRFAEADDDLTESIKLNPKHINSYFYRGLVRLKQMRFAEANDDLTKYIESDPGHTLSYYYRADARLGIGDTEGAAEDERTWRKLIE